MIYVEFLHTKVYKAASRPGALDMRTVASCGMACCRAGWVNVIVYGKPRPVPGDSISIARAAYNAHGYNPHRNENEVWYSADLPNETALETMRKLMVLENAGAAIAGYPNE